MSSRSLWMGAVIVSGIMLGAAIFGPGSFVQAGFMFLGIAMWVVPLGFAIWWGVRVVRVLEEIRADVRRLVSEDLPPRRRSDGIGAR